MGLKLSEAHFVSARSSFIVKDWCHTPGFACAAQRGLSDAAPQS